MARIRELYNTLCRSWHGLEHRGEVLLRLAALALCAALALRAVPAIARGGSKSGGTPVENTYVLSVTTGAKAGTDSSGTGVQFFAVRYQDAGGLERKAYVLICEGDMAKNSEQYTREYEEVQARVQTLTGYTAAAFSEAAVLASYQTCDFVFETETAVEKILGVEVYTRGSGTWTCQGLRVYRADIMYGTEMYGWYSSQYYLDFSGALLARMEKNDSTPVGVPQNYITLNWDADQCFHIDAQPRDGDQGRLNNSIPASEAAYDSHAQTGYYFELALEDTADSGVESLVNYYSGGPAAALSEMGLYEPLTLSVQYLDAFGDTRSAALPVLTSAVDWAVSQGVSPSAQLLGVAQQGETLGFAADLPDCASVTQYTLSYGAGLAESAAKIKNAGGALYSKRVKEQTDSKDSLVLTYFAVYDLADAHASATAAGGALLPSVSGRPISYYQQDHEVLETGKTATHQLIAYDGMALGAPAGGSRYLVMLDTDEMDAAATASDLSIRFTYVDADGKEASTDFYSVRQYSRDYYGLWPGSTGNVAYRAGMNHGGNICFVIELNNVNYFTGASLSLQAAGGDDWQMKKLSILRLISLGKRSVEWERLQGDGWDSDRIISRACEGYEAFSIDQSILIQTGESKDVRPSGGSGSGSGSSSGSGSGSGGSSGGSGSSVITDRDVDWASMRYSMSYEQSTQNLGFTRARRNYTVTVKVADDAVTATKDGDCGSTNHFYFQLIFENGRSGYVLANQQLSSDRFRAGYDESFLISTNQNYGELLSVNIIPNNLSDVGDVYDKLKVNSIQVTQDSNASLSKIWVINDVGWISIDYRDVAETSAVSGAQGRSEAELARNYPVTYSAYAMNLLFEITTAAPPASNTTMPQGSLYGTLAWRNSAGQLKTQTIDIVRAMYRYNNKTPQTASTAAGGSDDGSAPCISDSNTMFREGKTDRFVLAVEDVSKLVSLTLSGEFQQTCYWRISGVAVSTIRSEGTLQLNANNEYEFRYTTEPELVATHNSQEPIPYEQFFPQSSGDGSGREQIYVGFTNNTLTIQGTEETGWSTEVTREPISTNDTLDLVVYASAAGNDAELGTYRVNANLRYNALSGPDYVLEVPDLLWDAKEGVYYAMGLNAAGMVSLGGLYLKTNNREAAHVYIDHAVVRQVRSGVVINTYYLDFGGADIELGAEQTAASSASLPTERQAVAFKLPAGMPTVNLTAGKTDLAVAIRYTAAGDPRGREYQSPYIFLTDQEYASMTGGQLIRLDFREHYVKEITGVTFLAQGSVSARVEGACAAVYYGDDALCSGWYSFDGAETVGSAPRTLQATSNTAESKGALGLLRMTLTGTDGTTPLRVEVGYLDYSMRSRTVSYANLRAHALPNEDGALEAELLVPEISELRWVSITPHSAAGGAVAGTYLGDLTLRLETGSRITTRSRAIDRVAYETASGGADGSVMVNLSGITLTVRAQTSGENATERTSVNGAEGVIIESGEKVTLHISIDGSYSGFTVDAVETEGLSVRDANSCLSGGDGQYSFTPPANETGVKATYRITATSQEISAVSSVIEITVNPAPQATQTGGPGSGDGSDSDE